MSRLSRWHSSAGAMRVADMDTSHIKNTLRLVKQYARDRDTGYNSRGYDSLINDRPIHEWVADFTREIKRRSKVRVTGNTR